MYTLTLVLSHNRTLISAHHNTIDARAYMQHIARQAIVKYAICTYEDGEIMFTAGRLPQ